MGRVFGVSFWGWSAFLVGMRTVPSCSHLALTHSEFRHTAYQGEALPGSQGCLQGAPVQRAWHPCQGGRYCGSCTPHFPAGDLKGANVELLLGIKQHTQQHGQGFCREGQGAEYTRGPGAALPPRDNVDSGSRA